MRDERDDPDELESQGGEDGGNPERDDEGLSIGNRRGGVDPALTGESAVPDGVPENVMDADVDSGGGDVDGSHIDARFYSEDPFADAEPEGDDSAEEEPAAEGDSASPDSGATAEESDDDDDEDGASGDSELSIEELKKAVEAVLFSVGEPLAIRALADLFKSSVHDVRQAVEELRFEYVDTGRSFRLEDVAGGVQLLSLPAYDVWIRKLRKKQSQFKLSPAAFETLAVIAYKQPITKADLDSIRGVQCGPVIKSLLDRGLIKVTGRDESLGRPLLYGTTSRFLESFGISNLRDLPQPDPQPRSAYSDSDTPPAGSDTVLHSDRVARPDKVLPSENAVSSENAVPDSDTASQISSNGSADPERD
ncbi:MAG: SMC-Scp complex subunit ScpB [Planctomycetota bacterium]